MIQLISRKNLDVDKYNDCVANSLQSNVYGHTWYLDQAVENWIVFVLNDYEAVMPIPWRRKFFIKYVYPPFWILELGVFSKTIEDENEFLIELLSEFSFVETKFNRHNSFSMFNTLQEERMSQYLSLNSSYQNIFSNYRKDRRKDISKAQKFDLTENWNDNPMKLIDLYRDNVGKRVSKLGEEDYIRLHKIMSVCLQRKAGELLTVYDKENNLVAAGFFITYNGQVTILASSTDFQNRKNGANTFLIDRAIFKYQPNYLEFNFGGSSMKQIANYFYSFGAKTHYFTAIKQNRLPKLIKLFKR
jgi:hypothetical protein